MVEFKRHILDNGMVVLLNRDLTTPLVAFNLLYNAGSKHENENKTGLAHLFEHLMFLGTKNVVDFDYYTQKAGGENNAFTNADITDFYITLPAANIETAFWLESDRMVNLALDKRKFETEKRVVIEEFKETVLNIPYGDMWHHISAMSFKKHPYRWPTIGKEISHIENISLDDVMEFYDKYYHPGNAILSISGNFDEDEVLRMADKYFGNIAKSAKAKKPLASEPAQQKKYNMIIQDHVPAEAVFLAFHIDSRKNKNYYAQDLVSDYLGRGNSARLYQRLVKDEEIFSEIQAYVSGTLDPGLLVIEGMVSQASSPAQALEALKNELKEFKSQGIKERDLEKLKNKIENQMEFSETGILNKAINLAQYELLGDASLINRQTELYKKVNTGDILAQAKNIFKESNCSELIYVKS